MGAGLALAALATGVAGVAPAAAGGSTVTGIDMRLPAGYSISGVIRTSDGHPLKDALVMLDGEGESTFADARGGYTIGRIQAGDVVPRQGSCTSGRSAVPVAARGALPLWQ